VPHGSGAIGPRDAYILPVQHRTAVLLCGLPYRLPDRGCLQIEPTVRGLGTGIDHCEYLRQSLGGAECRLQCWLLLCGWFQQMRRPLRSGADRAFLIAA
jgi:hypothetical protein